MSIDLNEKKEFGQDRKTGHIEKERKKIERKRVK